MPFADLHCHPSFWAFQKRDFLDDANPGNHMWNIQYSKKDLKKMKKGKRATYAQSDFATLSGGDVRLVFASLYPVEKGFFMGSDKHPANVVGGLLNQAAIHWSRGLRKFLGIILYPFNKLLSKVLNNEGWGRDMVQKMVMNFSKSRIDFFQKPSYEYFPEISREYDFYKKFEDQVPQSPADETVLKYKIAQTGNELETIINTENKIAVVFTIEGFHSLCLKPNSASDMHFELETDEVIDERIKHVKDNWRIFFITFSHHFSNHLAGHAHSLPLLLEEIANPHPLKNKGFVRDKAERIIRKLLSITTGNQRSVADGRRVLIDVKHFSAASRFDYYKMVAEYNNQNPDDAIPVVASHCGYYGPMNELPTVSLDYLVANADKEEDDSFENDYYRWNINLCDDDIKMIVATDGLIGVSFDQRILGVKYTRKTNDDFEYWTIVIARNILGMVSSARHNIPADPHRIWQCFTIGTDFDGMIDPIDPFPVASKFGEFKTHLRNYLEKIRILEGDRFFLNNNPFTPEQVTDMICYNNAYNFTAKHFK